MCPFILAGLFAPLLFRREPSCVVKPQPCQTHGSKHREPEKLERLSSTVALPAVMIERVLNRLAGALLTTKSHMKNASHIHPSVAQMNHFFDARNLLKPSNES